MANIWLRSAQNPENRGRRPFPMDISSRNAPNSSPMQQPRRMSPRQMAKHRYSQTHTRKGANSRSASCLLRLPRGCRKPYRSPKSSPSRQAMPNCRAA